MQHIQRQNVCGFTSNYHTGDSQPVIQRPLNVNVSGSNSPVVNQLAHLANFRWLRLFLEKMTHAAIPVLNEIKVK